MGTALVSRFMKLLLPALLLLSAAVSITLIWRSAALCTYVVHGNMGNVPILAPERAGRNLTCACETQSTPVVVSHTASPSTISTNSQNVTKRPRGFVLAFRHYEQQTQAMRNFLQLQCLANSYGMRVIEPFVVKSFLSFPFDEILRGTKLLKFGQLTDMDVWNTEVAGQYGYSPVASWEEFLNEAPRQVIVVCVRYRNPPHIHVPTPGFNYRTGCPDECFSRFDASLKFLQMYGFTLLQKSCANFIDFAGTITASSFKETLVGKYESEDITVIMTEFRGLYGLYRLPVLSNCGILHHKTTITILPSSQITSDTSMYIASTLKGQPYVAILARVERLILHLHYDISTCTKELIQVLTEIYATRGISQRFLALDVGKFGSRGSTRHNLTSHGMQIFNAVYENGWTFDDWESSFGSIEHGDNPAYVANFQRGVASRSQCLVLVGGGGFQGQALQFYLQLKPNPEMQCVYKVCYRENNED